MPSAPEGYGGLARVTAPHRGSRAVRSCRPAAASLYATDRAALAARLSAGDRPGGVRLACRRGSEAGRRDPIGRCHGQLLMQGSGERRKGRAPPRGREKNEERRMKNEE